MRAALRAGVRPSVFVFREQPDKPWTNLDRGLVVALQTIEDERCPECGQPTWQCRSDNSDIVYRVEESVCFATRRLREYEDGKLPSKERAKPKDRKEWGVIRYPVVETISGAPVPNRIQYFTQLMSENAAVQDEVN